MRIYSSYFAVCFIQNIMQLYDNLYLQKFTIQNLGKKRIKCSPNRDYLKRKQKNKIPKANKIRKDLEPKNFRQLRI